LEWWMSSKLWLFLLVKHMVHAFCPSIMWVTEPKTATEKGNLRPCLRPKLDFTPKLERYSWFRHWPNSSCHM
jgi:hypothetical protein